MRFAKIARVLAILGALELTAGFVLAQTTNPLVGTWNFNLGYVERTALGTWRSTGGTPPYTFRMKNFVFDSTGKLSASILGTSGITPSSTTFFSGSGTAKTYNAYGTLVTTTAFIITGTRF